MQTLSGWSLNEDLIASWTIAAAAVTAANPCANVNVIPYCLPLNNQLAMFINRTMPSAVQWVAVRAKCAANGAHLLSISLALMSTCYGDHCTATVLTQIGAFIEHAALCLVWQVWHSLTIVQSLTLTLDGSRTVQLNCKLELNYTPLLQGGYCIDEGNIFKSFSTHSFCANTSAVGLVVVGMNWQQVQATRSTQTRSHLSAFSLSILFAELSSICSAK